MSGSAPSLHTNSLHDTNFALLNGASGEDHLRRTPQFLGGQRTQNTFTIPLGDLKGNLQSLLKHGDCEQFTTAVLAALAKKYADSSHLEHINTIMEGYGMVQSQGGYVLKQTPYDTVEGDLFAEGMNGTPPGSVPIVPNRLYSKPTPEQIALFQALYAFTALHETFHIGKRGWYTDEQVATTMREVEGLPIPTTGIHGTPVSSMDQYTRVTFFSDMLDQALKRHCGYPTTPFQKK